MNRPWNTIVAAMTCFIAATLLYWPTTHFDLLNWDDHYHLTTNPFLQPGSPGRYLHFWREPYGNLYVPITYNVWAFVYGQSFKNGAPDPTWLHATNVIVHGINVVLVFFVLRRLAANESIAPAMLGALLFAVHPLQVESVAWISELRGLLAAMFALGATVVHASGSLSLWERVRVRAYTHSSDARSTSGPHPRPLPAGEEAVFAHSVITAALLALGLLCKPSVAMAPLVWLVIDRLILARPWKSIGLSLALPMTLVVASLWSMRVMQSGTTIDTGAIWQRPFIAGDALAFYLRHLLWPFALTADYSRTPSAALADGAYAIAVVPLVVFIVLWRRRMRSDFDAALLVALSIFTVALLPVIGLVPFDFQKLSTVADRYAYLALLGPAYLVARSVRSPQSIAIAAMLLALLVWRNIDQRGSWKTDRTLWTHAVDVNPRAIVAMSNLADLASQVGDRARAAELFNRVITLAPNRASGYRGLAKLAEDAGDLTSALKEYDRAIAAEPTDPVAFNDSASVLVSLGKTEAALERYRKAVEIDPQFADAWNNLGALLLQVGQPDVAPLERAVAIHPRHPMAWANLALARDALGDAKAAEKALARYETVAGTSPVIRMMLARAARSRQDWTAAERWLRLTLEVAPNDVDALNTLGQVLAAMGRADEAIATFERAVALRPDLSVLKENLDAARRLKATR